jgi:hypothetical protein
MTTTTTPDVANMDDPAKMTAFSRWICDLYCLWRFCGKAACLRQQACRGDWRDCLPRCLPLVPPEALGFLAGFDEAQAEGLPFDEMLVELTDEVQLLTEWKRRVAESLPGRRGAATAAAGSPGPSPKAAQAS